MKTKLKRLLIEALKEDCPQKDITVSCLLRENNITSTQLIAKESGIFYGAIIIKELFHIIDPKATITLNKKEGSSIQKGDFIAQITSNSHPLLQAERVMLNLIQHLSGIATLTHQFVTTLNNPKIQLLDTRKTTPGLRFLEKEAVKAGGGHNHRLSLSDMVLIKENHLAEFKKEKNSPSLETRLSQFKKASPNTKIEIEIETLDQLTHYNLDNVDYIMLDNFSIENIQKAITICKEKNYKAQIEISGNITLKNIHHYSQLPIHRISIGAITHSARALDMSLLFG